MIFAPIWALTFLVPSFDQSVANFQYWETSILRDYSEKNLLVGKGIFHKDPIEVIAMSLTLALSGVRRRKTMISETQCHFLESLP